MMLRGEDRYRLNKVAQPRVAERMAVSA
jgi:hypothetical protein